MTDPQYDQMCKDADARIAAKKRGETSSAYLAKLAAMSPVWRRAYLDAPEDAVADAIEAHVRDLLAE